MANAMQNRQISEEDFTFAPAVRLNTPVVIGIAGASGSGKTYTALEVATGLAGKDGKIAFIDTEGRRALHYADLGKFKFDHLDFRAPYSPRRFLAALKQAERAGYAVIIVDSFSDEYVGEGGLVDFANAEYERVKGNTAAAWARPKAEHKLVTRWLRQARVHVIFCLRAEEKVEIKKVMRNGKEQTVVEPLGWMPVCEKNVPYEMTCSFVLHPLNPKNKTDRPGVPHPVKMPEQFQQFFPLDRPVGRETGVRLAQWCAGGKAIASNGQAEPPEPEEEPDDDFFHRELETALADPHMPPF